MSRGILRNLHDGLKILGNGEVTKKFTVRAHKFSQSAQEKLQAAGGTVEMLAAERQLDYDRGAAAGAVHSRTEEAHSVRPDDVPDLCASERTFPFPASTTHKLRSDLQAAARAAC